MGGNALPHPMTPIEFQNVPWITDPFLSHYKANVLKMFGWARKHSMDEGLSTSHQIWMGLASADMHIDWTGVTGSEDGFSVTVGTTHWTVLKDHPFYTLPGLKPERAYTAVITPIGEDDPTRQSFPFTTPTVVSG